MVRLMHLKWLNTEQRISLEILKQCSYLAPEMFITKETMPPCFAAVMATLGLYINTIFGF